MIAKLTKQKNKKTKKSMGRDEQTQTNKQTHKKKPSRFRNNTVSFLVVLVLLLQHSVWC
jgi:hypothetical protein